MTSPVQVRGLDHIVLNVADPERSVAWYRDKLGCVPERFDQWKAGEVLFPSVRVDATTIIDFLQADRSSANMDHVCLVVDEIDLDALAASGEFPGASEPLEVYGARGMGRSVYVQDPDGNTVELRNY